MMAPPSSNTGGKYPSMTGALRPRTKIDALSFTARGPLNGPVDALQSLYKGRKFDVVNRKAGWLGFASSALLTVDEAQVGLLAWGGQAQRGSIYASLMGTGCALADDLAPLIDLSETNEWPLRRLDIAADFTDGTVSIGTMIDAYERGGFLRGGRRPKLDSAGPADGSSRGRTLYVGNRENDMFCRGYEKGCKELADLVRELGPEAESAHLMVDGVYVDPMKWFRVELELKAKKRPIPYDVVQRRDEYFAGSYPYLSEILPSVEPQHILTAQKQGRMALDLALAHIRRQWGSTLFTALMVHEGDIGAVWEQIVGKKPNEALMRAGALLERTE